MAGKVLNKFPNLYSINQQRNWNSLKWLRFLPCMKTPLKIIATETLNMQKSGLRIFIICI